MPKSDRSNKKLKRSESNEQSEAELKDQLNGLTDFEFKQLLDISSSSLVPKKSQKIEVAIKDEAALRMTEGTQKCLNLLRVEDQSKLRKQRNSPTWTNNSPTGKEVARSAFKPSEQQSIEFIDDIEENQDSGDMISESSRGPNVSEAICGNPQQVPEEIREEGLIPARSGYIKLIGGNMNANESSMLMPQTSFKNTMLPPHHRGEFVNLKKVTGSDEVPTSYDLGYRNELAENEKNRKYVLSSELPRPPREQTPPRHAIEDNRVIERESNPKLELKRKKVEANRKRKNVGVVQARDYVEKNIGELPVDEILELIEGPKKSTTSVAVSTKKGGKKQNKQQPNNDKTSASANTTVTTGNVQNKGEATAAEAGVVPEDPMPAVVKKPKNASPAKQTKPKLDDNANATTDKPAMTRNGRLLTDDVDDEFVSADEAPPTPRPGDRVDTKQSTGNGTSSDLLMDGSNYRADDEDVSGIEKQVMEEASFTTVGPKAKKKQTTAADRRNYFGTSRPEQRQSFGARGSASTEEMRRASLGQHDDFGRQQPAAFKGRRPPVVSLGDFMDKETTTAVANHRAQSNNFKPKAPRRSVVDEVALDERLSVNTDMKTEEMASQVSSNSPLLSNDRSFSYADAAKKSAEHSREPTPHHEMSPSSQPRMQSPRNTTPTVNTSPVVNTEVCAPTTAPDTSGLSFFYEESTAEADAEQHPNENAAVPEESASKSLTLNLGGRVLRIGAGIERAPVPVEPDHMELSSEMKDIWHSFVFVGGAPVVYNANSKEE